MSAGKRETIQKLYTKEGKTLLGIPWEVYPRPQMKREKWQCLNGLWEFETEGGYRGEIRVPFCPESLLSGFEGKIRYGERLCYRRRFILPKDWQGKRILLHFGAVSSECDVYVNGKKAGYHENGYLAFSFEITEYLKESGSENELKVVVTNDLSGLHPYGKQKEKRGGMWYTPVSGIWQSVWIEPVPDRYVEGLTIRTDMQKARISLSGEGVGGAVLIFEGEEYDMTDGTVSVRPKEVRLWSPEDPYLYPFVIRSGEDEISSYFALRSIGVSDDRGVPRLTLNGRPYFFNGVLDQGYFSDGLYTPAMPMCYEQDILRMKTLGFCMLRKHIKIEPEQFYYDCDRLGMIVFQDMINNSDYSFLRDTILPTFGMKRVNDHKKHPDMKAREAFLEGLKGTVRQLSSHPCILSWTIFNEGWGQFEADNAYALLRSLDDTRIIDSTSGWFHQKDTDVDSLHLYFEKLHLGKRRELPQVLSEFGGYVYKVPEHSFHLEKTYGYKIFKDRDSYVQALRKVYLEEILPLARKGLSACVYTQVSDVEDETNGLLTYDRRICKILPEELAGIAQALQSAAEGRESEKNEREKEQ